VSHESAASKESSESPVDGGRTAGLLSSGAVMAAGTLASRVLGVVRTAVLAWAIGQISLSADAFATANTLPNSLMALIAGGVLNAVLVPQIVRAAKRSDGGKDYLDRLLTLAIIVLGGATLVATALAPVLIWIFGADTWSPAQVRLGTAFALWCLPQIFFYGLYTIYGQVLNARGSFGPYMWAPVVNNIVAIAGTVVFVALCGSGAKAPEWWSAGPIALLAGTATLGIIAQALVLLPAMRRSGYTWRPRIGWRGIGLSRAGRVAGWTLAATAVGQVGFAFISRAANSGSGQAALAGGKASGRLVYDNAYLLFILPHSLVAVSLVTAVFTRMSISAGAGRTDEVRADASLALRLTGLATVISTAAVLVLGEDLTRAIMFGNSRTETDALALATMAMILGLVPFSAQYLFSRICYAYEDARTPFWVTVVTICTWVAGSLLSAATLSPDRVVPGIGLAMSVSNLVGAVVATVIVTRRLGGLDGRALAGAHLRFTLAASVAAVAGWAASTGIHALAGSGIAAAYLGLAGAGAVMLAVYLGLLHLLRSPELAQILAPLRARVGR
jgi:putative peptidoglycan lipid II flippase